MTIQDLVIKQDTGRVGSGNMKINEFSQNTDTKLPFDLVDDALVFMRNDPVFYRKKYFPTISKVADYQRAGKKPDPNKLIGPMVDSGCNSYCKKFNIAKGPADLFTPNDRQNLISRIYSEECKNIEKGDY